MGTCIDVEDTDDVDMTLLESLLKVAVGTFAVLASLRL